MGNFNGEVKGVRITSTSSTNNYLITVEIQDTAHSVAKVEVDLQLTSDPDPVNCNKHTDNVLSRICTYKGNSKTDNPISGSEHTVIVKLYFKDNTPSLSEDHKAIVG
jgi:hypothetical protein